MMDRGWVMASKGKVNWYENDVLLKIEGATEDFLNSLALWVEGEAKVNMNVDTGFMRNATYTILVGGDASAGAESGSYTNRAGRSVQRNRVPVPAVPPGAAAVHMAAEYSIFQELINPSLYPALEKAKKIAKGVIEEIGKAQL